MNRLMIMMVIFVVRFRTGNIVFGKESTRHILSNLEQFSYVLDTILNDSYYDNKLHPNFDKDYPLTILINLHIKSMGPILEEKMIYHMDMYFRQQWTDSRLSYKYLNINESLKVSSNILSKLWKPDTYFMNGRGSYLHKIPCTNKLLRVSPEGMVLYSIRLTIKASCIMDLRLFPMDSQKCSLLFGSYAYSNSDVIYKWDKRENINYVEFSLAQFQFNNLSISKTSTKLGNEYRDALELNIHISRRIGYYIIQIYVPAYLMVTTSWISFWINREAIPARVTLGITTLLTTTTIAMSARQGMPKISYCTCLDTFLLVCFCFVFLSILENSIVHYYTKKPIEEGPILSPIETESFNLTTSIQKNANCVNNFNVWLFPNKKRKDDKSRQSLLGERVERKKSINSLIIINSLSNIDKISRYLFPAIFLLFNTIYWCTYMNIADNI